MFFLYQVILKWNAAWPSCKLGKQQKTTVYRRDDWVQVMQKPYNNQSPCNIISLIHEDFINFHHE